MASDKYGAATDFLSTLERMYKDSRILYEKEEYYNCCYLCGYVLECALKYILLKYGRDESGNIYTAGMLKTKYGHNTENMNHKLEELISVTNSILPGCRPDFKKHAPYMLVGRGGHKHWDPAWRYGEHPKWGEKEYCEHYIKESEYIFNFIAGIVISMGR